MIRAKIGPGEVSSAKWLAERREAQFGKNSRKAREARAAADRAEAEFAEVVAGWRAEGEARRAAERQGR